MTDPALETQYGQAAAFLEQGNISGARDILDQILSQDETFGPAHNAIGLIYLNQGNVPEAEKAFHRSTQKAPDYEDAFLNLANIYFETGRPADCVALLTPLNENGPDTPFVPYLLAEGLRETGRSDEARTAYQQAIALSPELFEAHFNLALLCKDQSDHLEAARHFEEARRLRPNHLPCSAQLGYMLLELGCHPEGQEALACGEGLIEFSMDPATKPRVIQEEPASLDITQMERPENGREFTL